WVHVVSTMKHAAKAAQAGVDALVVVGAEAGGHPPANEVSTLVMVRKVVQSFDIPVIAGGGAADGYGIAALLTLGADAVQLGTRFLLTQQATVHPAYKQAALAPPTDGTRLVGRGDLPVRMIDNEFARRILSLDASQTDPQAYREAFHSSSLKQAALDG